MSVTIEFDNGIDVPIEIILPNPEFGDVEYQDTNVLTRRTAGGNLKTLTNLAWPITARLSMTFRKISEEDKVALFGVLTADAGQIITLTDHYGISWLGILLTPNNKFIEEFPDDSENCKLYSWSMEFQGSRT